MTELASAVAELEVPTFEPMRLVLLGLFTTAFWLYAWNIGRMWSSRGRAARLLAGGILGLIGYVTAGQIKAAAYGLPVDALTYYGAAVAFLLILALVLLQLGGRKHEGA